MRRKKAYNIISGAKWCEFTSLQKVLKSEYGGEWLRPDGGEAGCMSRTPVGLVNHPAKNFNWQLSVAHGCLI